MKDEKKDKKRKRKSHRDLSVEFARCQDYQKAPDVWGVTVGMGHMAQSGSRCALRCSMDRRMFS